MTLFLGSLGWFVPIIYLAAGFLCLPLMLYRRPELFWVPKRETVILGQRSISVGEVQRFVEADVKTILGIIRDSLRPAVFAGRDVSPEPYQIEEFVKTWLGHITTKLESLEAKTFPVEEVRVVGWGEPTEDATAWRILVILAWPLILLGELARTIGVAAHRAINSKTRLLVELDAERVAANRVVDEMMRKGEV